MANEADGRVEPKIRELCANEQIKDADLDEPSKKNACTPCPRQDRFDLLEYLKTL